MFDFKDDPRKMIGNFMGSMAAPNGREVPVGTLNEDRSRELVNATFQLKAGLEKFAPEAQAVLSRFVAMRDEFLLVKSRMWDAIETEMKPQGVDLSAENMAFSVNPQTYTVHKIVSSGSPEEPQTNDGGCNSTTWQ